MALSVLTIGTGKNSHGIWESETETLLMTGEKREMFDIKHIIEQMEQNAANKEHFEKLREKYIKIMVEGGNTPEAAEGLLKSKMPFLYVS